MVIAIDPSALVPWVRPSERDIPEAERSTFYFRPLSSTELRAMVIAEGAPGVMWDSFLSSFAGWKNVKKADGTEVPFGTESRKIMGVMRDVATDATLSNLKAGDLKALLNGFTEVNGLSGDDRKN